MKKYLKSVINQYRPVRKHKWDILTAFSLIALIPALLNIYPRLIGFFVYLLAIITVGRQTVQSAKKK